MANSPDFPRRFRRLAWALGILAGCVALVLALIGYVTRGQSRLDLLAIGFVLIVMGIFMKPPPNASG